MLFCVLCECRQQNEQHDQNGRGGSRKHIFRSGPVAAQQGRRKTVFTRHDTGAENDVNVGLMSRLECKAL